MMKALLLSLMLVHCSVQEEQPYKYYNQNEYQYWHTPAGNQVVDTRRQSLRRQLTDLLGPGVPPAMLFSTAGTLGTWAIFGLKAADLHKRIKNEQNRINDAFNRITSNTDSIRATCNALASVVNTPDPMFVAGQTPATPTNAISQSIGQATGTSWPILFPLGTGAGNTVVAGAGDAGLDLSIPTTALGTGTTSNTVALSIADFNLFRLQAIQAFDALDNKMREVLSVAAPTCP